MVPRFFPQDIAQPEDIPLQGLGFEEGKRRRGTFWQEVVPLEEGDGLGVPICHRGHDDT